MHRKIDKVHIIYEIGRNKNRDRKICGCFYVSHYRLSGSQVLSSLIWGNLTFGFRDTRYLVATNKTYFGDRLSSTLPPALLLEQRLASN